MLKVLGSLVWFATFLGIAVSWFVAVINMYRMISNRKEGVPLFPNWYESPGNIIFRPHQLTDRGLAARRWCIYGVVGFFVCWAVAFGIGMLAER
jgi:hypothetical protein